MTNFTFSEAQKNAIISLFEQQLDLYRADKEAAGVFTSLYDLIIEYITDANGDPLPGVDLGVYSWIVGAKLVNADEGFFATFIRDYTIEQRLIRDGEEPSDPDTLAQRASNGVAFNFFDDIVDRLRSPEEPDVLPGIDDIGRLDAGAAASDVFGGNYSPWAGTLLFPYLGYDDFFRDWLLTTETVTDTETDATYKQLAGTYDLFAAIQAGKAAGQSASLAHPIGAGLDILRRFSNELFGTDTPPAGAIDGDQADLIEETNSFVRLVYSLGDTNPYLFSPGGNLIFDVNPLGAPTYRIGTLGDDNANNAIGTDNLGTEVIHAGSGDDTVLATRPSAFQLFGDLIDGGEGFDTVIYYDTVVPFPDEVRYVRVEELDVLSTDTLSPHEWRVIVSDTEGLNAKSDLIYDVENFVFNSFDVDLTISDLTHQKVSSFAFRPGDNTIRRISEATSNPINSENEAKPAVRFDFSLEQATESHTQRLITADDFAEEERSNALIVVDGKQLIGGAAFDFNKFEMRTKDFEDYTPLLGDRTYSAVLSNEAYYDARAKSINALFDTAKDLSGADAGTGGVPKWR